MTKRSTTHVPAILISLVLATAVFAGCGDDDDSTQSEPEASATTGSTQEVSLPEPITADGTRRVDLSDRLLTEISIPEGPDWTVYAFGSLWVKQDSGGVVRVDPETGKVIARIAPGQSGGGHVCQGIGASEEAIWSCPPDDTVTRIDPATNSIAANVRIDKLPDQGRLVSAADRIWVLTDSGERLSGIDTGTNKPATTVALGGRCADLAAAGTTVWATCPLEDRVLRIDAGTGEVSDELELAGATNAAVADDLWVGFEGGLAQIDAKVLEVLAVYELSPRYGGSIFATSDTVWVREEGERFLSRIDPETQQIVETIKAPELPSGGDVVQIEGSVWATAFDDATLVELKASGQ